MPAFILPTEPRRLRQKRLYQPQTESMAGLLSFSCDKLRSFLESDKHGTQLIEKENLCLPDKRSLILLDCRSFLSFNESHIKGSINVHCPAILRRRSGGRLPLRTVIPDSQIRDLLSDGSNHPVLLYEEHSRSPADESMATFVARCLQHELGLRSVYILEGGFHHFSLVYSHLCTKCPGLSVVSRGGGPHTPRQSSTDTPNHEPVEILPHLYLGSAYHSACKESLQRLGIRALLNVSPHTCPNHFEGSFQYKCIPVEDTATEDIGLWFNEAIEFIESVRRQNGKVLVHCQAGISRSATICMAYLMATKQLRMEDAYEFVKTRRKIVSPNFHFMGQLLSFESKVFGTPRSPLVALVPSSSPDLTFEFPRATTPTLYRMDSQP